MPTSKISQIPAATAAKLTDEYESFDPTLPEGQRSVRTNSQQILDLFLKNNLPMTVVSENFLLTPTHDGQLIKCTAGLTISANSALESGFYVRVLNTSSSPVIFDPSDAVMGMTEFYIYPFQSVLLFWDSSSWNVLNMSGPIGVLNRPSDFTIGPEHFNCLVYCSAEVDVYIDSNANVPLPVGFQTEIKRTFTAGVTFTKDAAVTLASADDALTLRTTYSNAVIKKIIADDFWSISGDVSL